MIRVEERKGEDVAFVSTRFVLRREMYAWEGKRMSWKESG